MSSLSRAARAYLLTVVLAGTIALAWRLATGPLETSPVFLVLLTLVVALGSRTVALGHRAEMALSLPLIVCALLAVGPHGAVDIAIVGMLSTCVLRAKPFPIHRTLFNVASITLVTMVSGLIYVSMTGNGARFAPSTGLLPLLASVVAYFATNTILVAMMIALSNRRPVLTVWKESFRWTLISYLAGGSIAAGMVALLDAFGPYSLVLAVPPILLIYYFFRLYADRAAERRKRIEEIERHNARLETEVARRTQELLELNDRLRQSNEDLTRVNRLKSEFLANMSHELRTPLNAIIGFSELLQERSYGPLGQEQLEFIRDIHAGGRHLLELINDILDLSKIEAGRLVLHREECDIGEILRETLTVIRPLALKKQLKLRTSIDPAARFVLVDAGKIRQVMYNLLSNGVKFTEPGGSITVETRAEGLDLVVRVEDTGIGIPPADLGRVFDEFYQVDGSYTRRHEGTGLGLALVKRLVEMHGGTVAAASRVGEGSAFQFRIPMAVRTADDDPTVADARLAPSEQDPVASGGRGLVMVVEDNPTNMRLTRNILAGQGYRVIEAPSGEEALRMVGARRPDLILMDLQLPGVDGLTLTRMIKSNPATSNIPTVALTACAMDGDEERARAAGCVGYITKPVSAADLPRQVAEYLELVNAT